MIIPPAELAAETLNAILEEFISREGTDYGEIEQSLAEKVAALLQQVKNNTVLIVFDEQLESINLVNKDDYQALIAENPAS